LFITSFIVYTTTYRYIFFTANGSKLISHIVKNFRPAVYRRQTSGLYRCLWPIRAAYRACIAVCGRIPPPQRRRRCRPLKVRCRGYSLIVWLCSQQLVKCRALCPCQLHSLCSGDFPGFPLAYYFFPVRRLLGFRSA